MARLSAKVFASVSKIPVKMRDFCWPTQALPKLLIHHCFILVLIIALQHFPPSRFVQARSLISDFEPLRSSDYDGGGRESSPAEYSFSPPEDMGHSPDNFGDHSDQQFPSYPYVNVDFIPPLVLSSVLENATAIQDVPIASIRVNYTLTSPNFGSSNHLRSQVLPSPRQFNFTTINDQFQVEYHLLNHQNYFAISRQSGEIYIKQKPSNYTFVLDVRAIINSHAESSLFQIDSTPYHYETRVPVLVEVVDINDNEPESVKNLLNCIVYDNIDIHTPICTASFKDADRGQNSELTYSISFEDENEGETHNIRIDPKTGSIYRRYENVTFGSSELSEIITATDHGIPYLETSIRAKITILSSNNTIKRGFNEKPYIPDKHSKANIILTGTEEPGTSISNLTPLDADGDNPVMHIVDGDPDAIFAIDDGSLIVAKNIDFNEKKTFNLNLMITDGASKNYENISILVPKFVKRMPNRFNMSSISVSSRSSYAQEQAKLTDVSKYAFDTSYARYKLYSASSDEAFKAFKVEESTGLVLLATNISYRFNGRHKLMFSIEDNRLSRDHFRSFVELAVNVNLAPPPPPPTTTTTTTSTTIPALSSTTITTTTTTTTTRRPTMITASTYTTLTFASSIAESTPYSTTVQPQTKPTSLFAPQPPTMFSYSTSPAPAIQYPPVNIHQQANPQQPYDQYNYPVWAQGPNGPTVFYPPPPSILNKPPAQPPVQPPSTTVSTFLNDSQIPIKTLARIVIAIMTGLFLCACTCLLCRCCCKSPKKRYRDSSGLLLNRSSFHSQQRLHTGQGPGTNGSMSRNINSRSSLRTPGHISSSAKALHSKYNAGDSVSLSAMNERSHTRKNTGLVAPPSLAGNQSGTINQCDDELYVNAFGPGHPQYLNELRRLKPDYTRMSARIPGNKKPTSSTNINNLRPSDNRGQSKSSSALPSTPLRTSSHSNSNYLRGKAAANQKPLPNRSSNNRSSDLNGSRTTNTSANVSPSLKDNNSRTVLLSSDDIRTPVRQPTSHIRHKHRTRHVHTDSTAEYDDVASRSTVDETTPQTSSENASMSEVPFDARFKTFVKQKKSKEQTNPNRVIANSIPVTTVDRYDKQLPPAPVDSEDTENEPTTNLLSEYYSDAQAASNGGVGASDNLSKCLGSNNRLSKASMSGSRTNNFHHQNGIGVDDNDDERNGDGDYDICEENNNNDSRAVGRRKQNNSGNNADNEDESDDSADEDEAEAEEGVYDLGTSNLFLD